MGHSVDQYGRHSASVEGRDEQASRTQRRLLGPVAKLGERDSRRDPGDRSAISGRYRDSLSTRPPLTSGCPRTSMDDISYPVEVGYAYDRVRADFLPLAQLLSLSQVTPSVCLTWRCIDLGARQRRSKRASRLPTWDSGSQRWSPFVATGLPSTACRRHDLGATVRAARQPGRSVDQPITRSESALPPEQPGWLHSPVPVDVLAQFALLVPARNTHADSCPEGSCVSHMPAARGPFQPRVLFAKRPQAG